MLKNSNKEIDTFAYTASHDLQEPLRKIITFSERLKIKFSNQLGEEGLEYTDRIISSAQSMKTLIESLLEFSKTTRSAFDYKRIEMRDVMEKVLQEMDLKIVETNASIKISFLTEIEAIESEMHQLFGNLLSNAIKFKRRNEAPVIEVTGEMVGEEERKSHHLPQDKDFVKIIFKDNGIGFDEKYSERIFQIFQRLHGKSEYSGSGVGLAICKKIVDNHNGVIYAKSGPGRGASFIIILPRKQV